MGVTTPTIMNQTTCDVEGSSNIPNIKAQAIFQIIVIIKLGLMLVIIAIVIKNYIIFMLIIYVDFHSFYLYNI